MLTVAIVIPRCFSSGALSISSNAIDLAIPSPAKTCYKTITKKEPHTLTLHLKPLTELIKRSKMNLVPMDKNLSDCCCQSCFPMVDMSNRSNVHMGLPAQSLGNQNQMDLTSTSMLEKETQTLL